ncbi:hypothetical protein DFP72DRAFT_1030015 [Ephemerocybe angulata]|uniref:Uncharacterized protein n=1 Tax=Ephemerocybe angulata TaxID=980116 RepID=A0A8H6MGL2_9AGAR|nr:hypothetical protein DFP72DRAFT_1030015 [Tulosesus angulatus]
MLFIWETEQSLFSDLEEGPGASEEDRLDTLIDALHAPFEEKKKELKKQMAETFVPVMRHVKTLHQRIDERVDVPFGKGLKIFNSGCKTLEAATLAEYQEMVETYETTRANIANLLEQLKAEYAHRDNLWVNLEAQINELVDPAIAEIQDTPAQVERTIAKLEKYHQNMDKDGKDTTILSEKRLKELISKLG